MAVGERLLADARDGAFFVALEDARDRPMVASAIASALGVREKTDRDLEHGVIEYVRDLDIVLILDNFEQVVGPGAPLVAELVGGSPRLRVLVTSRTVLRLSAEQEFTVPPLSAPDPDEVVDPAALARFEAVALFVDRARSVDRAFHLDADNAPAVARIAGRLDGLPLAIELAAARVKVLSPQAILDRLERHLPVLAAGATDLPARQRTLEGAIDWSHELLAPAERRLFARLAVFAGGWTLESAEAVCNVGDELGIDTLDGLASLADKSLIHRIPVADGETRFAMLQVMREYAGAKLGVDPDAAEVRARHARDVLALVETAEPELRRSDLRRWQHRLRREAENVRSALRWAVEHDEAEIGLGIAAAIWDYWHYWAEVREGVGWLETLLTRPAVLGPSRVRARGLTALGGLVYWQGNADRAGDLYEEALAIYRRLGSQQEVAAALMNTAWAAAARYDLAMGEARATEALEHFRAAGDSASATLVELWLTMEPVIIGVGGDIQTAIEATGRAVEVSRQVGRAHEAADFLGARALIHRIAGDHRGGIAASQSALTAWYELGNLGRLPLCFKILAAVELAAGHPERAVRLGAAAKRITAEIGGDLAEVFGQLGDPVEEARPLLAPDVYARAVAEGGAMRLDELVDYALATDEAEAESA
jgi:predicted ATPase